MITPSKLQSRIVAFSRLGDHLKESLGDTGALSGMRAEAMEKQAILNPWFTIPNQKRALGEWAGLLTADNLKNWLLPYHPHIEQPARSVSTGIIMAGNIPLVGFHDLLSVLIAGHKAVVKVSSKDSELIRFIVRQLAVIDPALGSMVEICEDKLSGIEAVIATGSNNSARYFEYYFGKYPNIIRKNRNSVAILDGSEQEEDIQKLGDDIFSYFGLGCRNVSRIFIPHNFDPASLITQWSSFSWLEGHSRYMNNYEYNKAIYLVNRENFLDGGFFILKEGESLSTPVSVLNYSFYSDKESVMHETALLKDSIQCIVSKSHIPFGTSQSPALSDYADNIDTIQFLLKLK